MLDPVDKITHQRHQNCTSKWQLCNVILVLRYDVWEETTEKKNNWQLNRCDVSVTVLHRCIINSCKWNVRDFGLKLQFRSWIISPSKLSIVQQLNRSLAISSVLLNPVIQAPEAEDVMSVEMQEFHVYRQKLLLCWQCDTSHRLHVYNEACLAFHSESLYRWLLSHLTTFISHKNICWDFRMLRNRLDLRWIDVRWHLSRS